jgi:hypothetical protein
VTGIGLTQKSVQAAGKEERKTRETGRDSPEREEEAQRGDTD